MMSKRVLQSSLLCLVCATAVLLGLSCHRSRGSASPSATSHSGIFLRGDCNAWRRLPAWEFADCGGGRYVLRDKDLFLEFALDVRPAHKWAFPFWGGGDAAITPGVPYRMGQRLMHFVQCGYRTLHCDSIVLVTDGDNATITLHTSSPPDASLFADSTTATRPLPIDHSPRGVADVEALILGNSLTHMNRQDYMLNNMCLADGALPSWSIVCRAGTSLQGLWDEGALVGPSRRITARAQVASRPWTHIFLQDYSTRALMQPEEFERSLHQWVEYIRRWCPRRDVDIVLVVNWPQGYECDDYLLMGRVVENRYVRAARREGITLCPTGEAYVRTFVDLGRAGIEQLYLDECHPTLAASYMAACMKYSLATGKPATAITWRPEGLDAEQADAMRRLAEATLQQP